ncbi:MBL fold metallo-hydrolase [bacterium]|nr:MBL fold metallo-hydrolase [bacterium]
MTRFLATAAVLVALTSAPGARADGLASTDTLATDTGRIVVHAVHHASFLLEWDDLVIAVDPVGDARDFLRLGRPHVVLVTHRHGDHFDADMIRTLASDHNVVITPLDIAESIPACEAVLLVNGDTHTVGDLAVTAVPAYNHTPERLAFHPRGRDNGYLLERRGVRVYVSGDTEDIPEQADLAPVDAAFLCMNLPWTMSVDQAARAVAMVAPRVLYPYHLRHRDGSHADLDRLDALLDDRVAVRRLAWY